MNPYRDSPSPLFVKLVGALIILLLLLLTSCAQPNREEIKLPADDAQEIHTPKMPPNWHSNQMPPGDVYTWTFNGAGYNRICFAWRTPGGAAALDCV